MESESFLSSSASVLSANPRFGEILENGYHGPSCSLIIVRDWMEWTVISEVLQSEVRTVTKVEPGEKSSVQES